MSDYEDENVSDLWKENRILGERAEALQARVTELVAELRALREAALPADIHKTAEPVSGPIRVTVLAADIENLRTRTEKAEAENARLRSALEQAREALTRRPTAILTALDIIDAALEGEGARDD